MQPTPVTHLLCNRGFFFRRRHHLGQGSIPIVASLHACRKEFESFQCAVMATPPQTVPRVLAVGNAHTAVDELQEMGDVAGILSGVGSGEPLRKVLSRDLGGGQHRPSP